jgi:hypothetical protein
MSRGKKDREASIKWWNKLKLSNAEIEIVWRRETQKKK